MKIIDSDYDITIAEAPFDPAKMDFGSITSDSFPDSPKGFAFGFYWDKELNETIRHEDLWKYDISTQLFVDFGNHPCCHPDPETARKLGYDPDEEIPFCVTLLVNQYVDDRSLDDEDEGKRNEEYEVELSPQEQIALYELIIRRQCELIMKERNECQEIFEREKPVFKACKEMIALIG